MTISGAAASSLVQIAGWHNGSSLGTTSYGNTDGGGSANYYGSMNSSTLGSWVEDIYVGGISIGELEFTVSPADSCSFGDTGDLMIYSTDRFYGGVFATYPPDPKGAGGVTHFIYSGPCYFSGGSVSAGAWIIAGQTTYGSERDWSASDNGYPSNSYSTCPRCYVEYDDYSGYPAFDLATLNSTIYNYQSGEAQTLSTLVTLWIDWGFY